MTLKQYQLIIFDWDGTLMDSTGRIVSAMQTSARLSQLTVPTEQQVKSIIGLSMQAVMQTLFAGLSKRAEADFIETYRYQYVEGDNTPSPLFDGAKDLLDRLKQQDKKLTVATGKARHGLQRVLGEVGLSDFFHHSICADEASSKPHPEMVYHLIKQTDIAPENTLVIGDSVHDLRMANNAGVDAIGVTSGANDFASLQNCNPLAILDRVTQLNQWLEPIAKESNSA